jgi:NADPH:quinone reductase-like Zn-dependent oxidoreductase
MKKIIIRKPGSFERLELVDEPTPTPLPGHALVRTHAVGVNFADVVVRLGLYPSAKKYVGWPITPGFELSGVIESLGADCDDSLRVGDAVYGVVRFFAYSTHVQVPLAQLRKKPENLSFEQAAAIPVAAFTAYYGLVIQGQVKAGQRVLVHSAAGGVGSTLVQMATLLGAVVTGVVGSADKVPFVASLGASHVIDRGGGDWHKQARAAAVQGYDIVLDANGVATLADSYRLLRPTGRVVVYGAHTMLTRGSGRANWLKLAWDFLRTPRFSPLDLTNDNKSVLAFNLSYLFDEQALLKGAFDQLDEWYRTGQLRVAELTSFPLQDAAQAHRVLQSGNTRGKLVLLSG